MKMTAMRMAVSADYSSDPSAKESFKAQHAMTTGIRNKGGVWGEKFVRGDLMVFVQDSTVDRN